MTLSIGSILQLSGALHHHGSVCNSTYMTYLQGGFRGLSFFLSLCQNKVLINSSCNLAMEK